VPEEDCVRQERPTYWDYLRLTQLLDLQSGLESDETHLAPDELHFIMVHQIFELWFKLVIHELRLAIGELSTPRVPEEKIPYVVHHLKRVNTILNHAISQFDVVETLDPQDFIDFRDKLVPASGLQSFQFRVLEILLGIEGVPGVGYEDTLRGLEKMTRESPTGDTIWAEIERARSETTLRGALHEWLYRTPIDNSSPGSPDDEKIVERFLAEYMEGYRQMQAATLQRVSPELDDDAVEIQLAASLDHLRKFLSAEDVSPGDRARIMRIRAALLFIESYRTLPLLAWPRLLLDTIVELEERLLLWRTRHARMVERIIGQRIGTGGTSGAAYLHQRATHHIFTELWEIRSVLLPRAMVPALRNRSVYDFEKTKP
jgi:tryptophan 2,3-dioxygenase